MSQAPKTTALHASRSTHVRPTSTPTVAIITSVATSRPTSIATSSPASIAGRSGKISPTWPPSASVRYTTTADSR